MRWPWQKTKEQRLHKLRSELAKKRARYYELLEIFRGLKSINGYYINERIHLKGDMVELEYQIERESQA